MKRKPSLTANAATVTVISSISLLLRTSNVPLRNWLDSICPIYPIKTATHNPPVSFDVCGYLSATRIHSWPSFHSNTNENLAIAKMPNLLSLEWNKFVLEKGFQQPSLQTLCDWLLNFSKTCRDLNTSLWTVESSHAQMSLKPSTIVQNYSSASVRWTKTSIQSLLAALAGTPCSTD